jgi:hypothetical protein
LAKKKAGTRVFISHSSVDTWVARQIALRVKRCGASFFLDEADVQGGDDFEDKILEAAEVSTELLVLLTPWATRRPYIWMEIGSFWSARKRITGILHGLTPNTVSVDPNIPIVLKRTRLLTLNEIDRFFEELKLRVKAGGGTDG